MGRGTGGTSSKSIRSVSSLLLPRQLFLLLTLFIVVLDLTLLSVVLDRVDSPDLRGRQNPPSSDVTIDPSDEEDHRDSSCSAPLRGLPIVMTFRDRMTLSNARSTPASIPPAFALRGETDDAVAWTIDDLRLAAVVLAGERYALEDRFCGEW